VGNSGRLIRYLRPYRLRVSLAVALSFGVAALTALSLTALIPTLDTLFGSGGLETVRESTRDAVSGLSPALADLIVDTFFTSKRATFTWLVAAVIAMTLVKGVLRFLNVYLVGSVAIAAARDIMNQLFAHLIRQPVLFVEKEGVGTVASRFTADADEVVRGLKTFTGTVFREPIQFLFLLLVALSISPLLTVAAFVIFPLIALLIRQAGRVAKRNARRVLAHRSALLGILQEAFFGIRVVQTFGGEARETSRFSAENHRLYDRNRRLVRVEAVTSPSMEFLAVLGISGAILLGGMMALEGELRVGAFFAFYVSIGALYEPIRKLGSAVPRLQAGFAGAGRIFAYLDREPAVRDAEGATKLEPLSEEIRLEDVGVTYGDRSRALSGVSVSLGAREQVAIVGASGAGKSTLVGLLPRLYDPEEGRVLFDGRDLRTVTLESVRRQIALVPQETVLMNDTVRNNIAFARPDASEEEILAAAGTARVTEFLDRLEAGLETVIGERGTSLSGGQRQRIAVARALLVKPRVLILDEAVSNVDDESAALIREALEESRHERTTIVITHRLETIARADRILVLDRGRLVADGSHEDLLRDSREYRSLVRSAAGEVEPA
jgi:ABC-type multidrug transport system fused ATPase/permease subunit